MLFLIRVPLGLFIFSAVSENARFEGLGGAKIDFLYTFI